MSKSAKMNKQKGPPFATMAFAMATIFTLPFVAIVSLGWIDAHWGKPEHRDDLIVPLFFWRYISNYCRLGVG
jgi:hypothetical protein